MDSVDVVMALLREHLSGPSELRLIEMDYSAQARPARPRLDPQVNSAALHLRRSYGVPFWTAAMLTAVANGQELPAHLFEAATFHRDMSPSQSIWLEANNVTAEALRDLIAGRREGCTLLLSSQVRCDGRANMHIPMLDLRVAPSVTNRMSVVLALKSLGATGYLLESGRSYHFYGTSLSDVVELTAFLGRSMLLSPLVDQRWIAHQLVECSCALRISESDLTNALPRVVDVL